MDEVFESVWDLLMKADETLNFAEFFAGLGGSKLMSHLGQGGWAGAAKQRGHNVQGYELDPSLKQGDPNYHIRDILDMSAEEVMDDFDWQPIDAVVASTPCKAFTTASGNIGWQWDERWMDQYENVLGKPMDESRTMSEVKGYKGPFPDMMNYGWHWERMKPKYHQMRGTGTTGTPIGFSGVRPAKDVDEARINLQAQYLDPAITTRSGKQKYSDDYLQSRIDSRNMGVALAGKTVELIDDLKSLNPEMKYLVENPTTGRLRYQDVISKYPMTTIDAAAYRDPAHSQYFKFPRNEDVFEMIPGSLPALKPTDLFGELPSTFRPRPRIPRSQTGILYETAPRGSKSGIQGVGDIPANQLFPGSPLIDKFHVRSVIPYWLGHDFTNALEAETGIRPRVQGQRLMDQIDFNTIPLPASFR